MGERWEELSADEKQQEMFGAWLSPDGVEFSNSEAEKSYRERTIRIKDAILLNKTPDRVPVFTLVNFFPAYYVGLTPHDMMYDYEKLIATISLMYACLVVYPLPDWQDIEDNLKALPAFDTQAQLIRHLVIGRAADLELDGQGRVLLPQALREFAGLTKRVTMVGQGRNFELWDDTAWSLWCRTSCTKTRCPVACMSSSIAAAIT